MQGLREHRQLSLRAVAVSMALQFGLTSKLSLDVFLTLWEQPRKFIAVHHLLRERGDPATYRSSASLHARGPGREAEAGLPDCTDKKVCSGGEQARPRGRDYLG